MPRPRSAIRRKQIKWMVDPELAEEYNKATRSAGMQPNIELEELMKLFIEYILPKLKG